MDVSNQVTMPKNVVTVILVSYVREDIPPVYMMKITKGLKRKTDLCSWRERTLQLR